MAEAGVQGLITQLKEFGRLPGVRQAVLMVALAASVALGIMLVLWLREPGYRPLYGHLADKEAGQVVDALQANNIPFKLDENSGSIMVPPERIYEARLKLAAQGLPQSTGTGFELLEQAPGLGVSQFMENARYQHAMEIELARTIASLQPVQNARVHLALPKPSVFVREQKKPAASVVVQLYQGRSLERGQVAAIVHLVAASVPGMETSQVTVVDQRGNLLTDGRAPDADVDASHFAYTQQVEQDYIRRVEDILSPVLGRDRIRAQVTADLDFTRTEQTRESYDPNRQVVRSEQSSEERRAAGSGPGGIPGALSNQPPGPAALTPISPATPSSPVTPASPPAAQATQTGSTAAAQDVTQQSTRNYEIDRTISHISQPVGSVRRLSIAVVVDDWERMGRNGKPVRTPLNEQELGRITSLVKQAVGFDPARGDSVNVINQSFQPAEDLGAAAKPAFWEQGPIRELIQQGLLALVALGVILLLIRPLMRNLLQGAPARAVALEPQTALPPGVATSPERELSDDRLSLGKPDKPMLEAKPAALAAPAPPRMAYEEQVSAARSLAAQDPKRVAQVVKTWIASDE